MENMKYIRRHYHESPKAGIIYCCSSYELKAALILDANNDVIFYETQIGFEINGNNRILDFCIHFKDGSKKHIEIKPKRRLEQFKEQIEDNKQYAASIGNLFEVWTEEELGLTNEYYAKKWADKYLTSLSEMDFTEYRKILDRKKAKKHYRKKIAQDKVKVFCEYCQEEHEVLRINYDKNIAKHDGEYWCEKKGGHEAGKKPKKKKVNPYAADGKKQCTLCNEVKKFEEFGLDKSRSDGYASRCLECRARNAKKKYNKFAE